MVHMEPIWSPHGVHWDSTGTLYMNLAELPAKESPQKVHEDSMKTPQLRGDSMWSLGKPYGGG